MTVRERDAILPEAFVVVASAEDAAVLAPLTSPAEGIQPVLVATGPDPMTVDEALDDLGALAGRILLVDTPEPGPVAEAAALLPRLESLLADDRPAVVLVRGGSATALAATQVAVWRDVPVVAVPVADASPVEAANQVAIAALAGTQGEATETTMSSPTEVLRRLVAERVDVSGGPRVVRLPTERARTGLTA